MDTLEKTITVTSSKGNTKTVRFHDIVDVELAVFNSAHPIYSGIALILTDGEEIIAFPQPQFNVNFRAKLRRLKLILSIPK